MIKIRLSCSDKKEIEKIFFNCRTIKNIIKYLRDNEAQIGNYEEIHKEFYKNGKFEEDKFQELLLADREKMKSYIDKFGSIEGKEAKELLKEIFRYKNLSQSSCWKEILRKIGITVCPYCNRQYIITLKSGNARAELDHYYPKSKYPFLAISLYNLIPCCSTCNKAKSNRSNNCGDNRSDNCSDNCSEENRILYPYHEEMESDINIKILNKINYVKVLQGVSNDFEIDFDGNKENKVLNNHIEFLKLEEFYNEHKDYVRDIIKSHNINSESYMNELYTKFPELFSSIDEVRSLLYMTKINKEDWGQRPLSKSTHDIDKQLRSGNIKIEKS